MNLVFKKLLFLLSISILLFSVGLPTNVANADDTRSHTAAQRAAASRGTTPSTVPSAPSTDPGSSAADLAASARASVGSCSWRSILGGTSTCILNAAVGFASTILEFVGAILGWAAGLFDFIMEQTITSGNYNANQPIIAIGWNIVRELATILIVLSMLAIAVGTILQVEGYMIKKTLPRLLIAGLLVNFSLAISGVVVDISNVLAFSFWEGAKDPTTGSIAEVLIKGFNLPQLLLLGPDSSVINVLLAAIIGIIFMLIFIFLLFAFSFMFVFRMIGLWIILLLSPAAFVAMAVPGLNGYASKWWDALIKQSMYAPAALLLVYVVSQVIQRGLTASIFTANGAAPKGAFIADPSLLLNYVALAGILFYSLKLAQEMGGQTAALGTKAFDKARARAKGLLPIKSTRAALTRGRERAVGGALSGVTNNRLGQSVLRGTAFLGTGAAVQSAIARGQKASEYRRVTDAATLSGRSVNDQARALGTMSNSAQALAIKNMDASTREKVLKEMKKHDVRSYNTLTTNLAQTLRQDEARGDSGQVKRFDGLDTGDIAKALAPNDLQRALEFKNPALFGGGAAPAFGSSPEAQRDINDLINGMSEKARSNTMVNLAADPGDMGKYYREYFKNNGTTEDMMATRKTVNAGEQMLKQIFEENLGGPLTTTKDEFKTAMQSRKDAVEERLWIENEGRAPEDKLPVDKLKEKIEKEFLKEKRKVMVDMFGKIFKESGGEKLEKEMQRMESILFEPENVTPNREKE